MAERTTWQVRQFFPDTKAEMEDLGDWEPFAIGYEGGIFLRRQTIVEGEKSSHEPGMLAFKQRHPDARDFPED